MGRKNFAATGSFLPEHRATGHRPDRRRQPARVQHLPQPPAPRLGARLATSTWPTGSARAHNRGMVEFCAVDERLLSTCYVPLADFERAEKPWPRSRSRCRRGRPARGVRLPALPLAEPPSPSTRSGRGPRRPAYRSCFHVGGTGDLIDANYFENGLPIPPDFHGGEENFRSVDYMGIPGPPDADARNADLRRRARALPPSCKHRRDRAGRDLAAELDAPDGVGLRGLPPARGAPPAAFSLKPSEYVDAPGARDARTPPRTWAGSPSRWGRRSACSPPTTPTWRGAGGPTSVSSAVWAMPVRSCASASTPTTSST